MGISMNFYDVEAPSDVNTSLGGSSSRVVLGAAKWRENIRKSKDPGFAPDPGKLKKVLHVNETIIVN